MSAWHPSEDHERLHIDHGPRINALHFISEALDIPHSERQNHPLELGQTVSLEPAVTYSANIPKQKDDEDNSLTGSPPEGLLYKSVRSICDTYLFIPFQVCCGQIKLLNAFLLRIYFYTQTPF
jgi:hypothetical protein